PQESEQLARVGAGQPVGFRHERFLPLCSSDIRLAPPRTQSPAYFSSTSCSVLTVALRSSVRVKKKTRGRPCGSSARTVPCSTLASVVCHFLSFQGPVSVVKCSAALATGVSERNLAERRLPSRWVASTLGRGLPPRR